MEVFLKKKKNKKPASWKLCCMPPGVKKQTKKTPGKLTLTSCYFTKLLNLTFPVETGNKKNIYSIKTEMFLCHMFVDVCDLSMLKGNLPHHTDEGCLVYCA